MGPTPWGQSPPRYGARSFVIGFVLITLAYMIPVLGIVMWAIVGVLGLGCASLSFISAYRRENPKPVAPPAPEVPPPAPPMVPPPPVPATYQYCRDVRAGCGAAALRVIRRPPAAAAAAPAIALPAGSHAVLAAMPKALFRDRLAAFILDIILMIIVVNIFDSNDPVETFFVGPARLPHRILDVEADDGRRNHLPAARGTRRRRATQLRRRARARAGEHLFPRGARHRRALDPEGPRQPVVARQDRRHLRREGARETGRCNTKVKGQSVKGQRLRGQTCWKLSARTFVTPRARCAVRPAYRC